MFRVMPENKKIPGKYVEFVAMKQRTVTQYTHNITAIFMCFPDLAGRLTRIIAW